MSWYPFDTQACSMTVSASEDLNDFIRIESNGHAYLGPVELTQYFIRDTEIFNTLLRNSQQAVTCRITLGRRLLGTILTVFFPTILMNVVGHIANYFKPFFFEAVISINLTVMLVLMTMFISVSNQLPKTSYIKMIDVWLIFNLFVPFVEVLLHTYKDSLREEENQEVNQHGTVRSVGDDEVKKDSTDSKEGNSWVRIKRSNEVQNERSSDLVSRREDVQVFDAILISIY